MCCTGSSLVGVSVAAGHPGNGELLKKAGIEHADSLLIVGVHDYDDVEADIQVSCMLRVSCKGVQYVVLCLKERRKWRHCSSVMLHSM
jgi:hypothetical protein